MEFDVTIVGGGPAGTAAAIHLAARGARVLLAEQKRFPRAKLCGEFISPECLEHFARLGALDAVRDGGGARVDETVFYARGGRPVRVPSAWFGAGVGGALGLSRAEMDSRLLGRARALGVCVVEEATLAGVVYGEGARVRGVRLHVSGEGERAARSLVTVDATGRQRAVARRVEREANERVGREMRGDGRGAERHSSTPRSRARLVAFKAHLEGARGSARACEIYFYPGGYGGLSPVEGGLSNLCFIARAEDVRARGSDAARVMREVVMRNRRASETLSEARAHTPWLGVALESFGRDKPAPAEGLLAVGDAAAFIDPFTGSGMLMALESGELAARAISDWLPEARRGRAPFSTLARAYETLYGERFDARLRLCSALRRAAFAPAPLVNLAALALGASERLRRTLARATRGTTPEHSPTRG